jgi:hypothetical protein
MATFAIADVTPVPAGRGSNGGQAKTRLVDITVSGNYTTGGDALTAAALGAQKVLFFEGEVNELSSTTAIVPRYDYTNSKLKFYKANGTTNLTEFGNGTSAAGSFRARITYI